MSRAFVQVFDLYYKDEKLRRATFWEDHYARNSAETYTAILCEGFRLYGTSLQLVKKEDELELRTMSHWCTTNVKEATSFEGLSAMVNDIFIEGRFAPFRSDSDDRYNRVDLKSMMRKNVARYPLLVQVLIKNGYLFDAAEQNIILFEIFTQGQTTIETSLSNLQVLETQFAWNINQLSAEHLDRLLGKDNYFAMDTLDYSPWVRFSNDKYGRSCVFKAVNLMKILYEDGKAFLDISQVLSEFRETEAHKYDPCLLQAYQKYFPEMMSNHKGVMAISYILSWQHATLRTSCPDTKRTILALSMLLNNLDLNASHLAKILCDERVIKSGFFHYAIDQDRFFDTAGTAIDDLLSLRLSDVLRQPMSGHLLEKVKESFLKSNASEDLKNKFESLLAAAVMSFQFDLDRLSPDDEKPIIDRCRTSLGWMDVGQNTRIETYGRLTTTFMDPHQLLDLPPSKRYGKLTWDTHLEIPFINLQDDPANIIRYSAALRCCENKYDITLPLTRSNSQSGNTIAKNTELMKRGKVIKVAGNTTGPYSTTDEKILWMPDTKKSINKTFASGIYSVGDFLSKELQHQSYAARDLLLAHALVNGNVALAQRLINGELPAVNDMITHGEYGNSLAPNKSSWRSQESEISKVIHCDTSHLEPDGSSSDEDEDEGSDKEKTSKQESQRTEVKGEPKVEEALKVFPTLAHLQILQALGRKPLKVFLMAILLGSPFRHGQVNTDEETHLLADRPASLSNDGPMMSLLEQKQDFINLSTSSTMAEQQRSIPMAGTSRKRESEDTSQCSDCLRGKSSESGCTNHKKLREVVVASGNHQGKDGTKDQNHDNAKKGKSEENASSKATWSAEIRFVLTDGSISLQIPNTMILWRRDTLHLWVDHIHLLLCLGERKRLRDNEARKEVKGAPEINTAFEIVMLDFLREAEELIQTMSTTIDALPSNRKS